LVLPVDRETGRPRGFAFVEYSSEAEATAAAERFNGQELEGRALRINPAEDRPRGPRGGHGDGGGFRGSSNPFEGGRRPFKSKGSRRGLRARKRGGY
jgi:RNA recognition motif-containing protein